jgi:hypothetical protein
MLGLAYFLAWGLLVGVRLHLALSANDAEAASGTL